MEATKAAGERGREWEHLFTLLSGFFRSQVLYTVARLGIADHLSGGTRDADELATATDCVGSAMYRLLRSAVGLELLSQHEDGRFGLTAAGELLRSGTPESVRNLVMFLSGEEQWRALGQLELSVRSGKPALEHLLGMPVFAYLAEHPEREQIFNAAMREWTTLDIPGIVASCDLSGVRTIVDLGGEDGALLAGLLKANPQLRGDLFDAPTALRKAEPLLAAAGLTERCGLVAGDFFVSVPASRDAYLLKSVLHDWDDEQCGQILANCRAVMRTGDILLIVEMVVPDDASGWTRDSSILLSDLNMMAVTGGRERTEAEFHALLDKAGFTLEMLTRCPESSGFTILRARRAQPRDEASRSPRRRVCAEGVGR